MARHTFIKTFVIATVTQIFTFQLAAYSGVGVHSFNPFFLVFCLCLSATFSWFYSYPEIEIPQERTLAQPEVPGKTALSESELGLQWERDSQADDDVMTISASFIDSVEIVGDIDIDTEYDNGPFLTSWFDLGSIKEILELLQPLGRRGGPYPAARRLLERAYSQDSTFPDLSHRNEAYTKYGDVFRKMKKITFGNRLFKTGRLSRLGVGPRDIQTGDWIFFAPRDSVFLVFRPSVHENIELSDSQLYYRLISESFMGDIATWSDRWCNLATLPLQEFVLQREKTDEPTEEAYNSNAKLRPGSLWFTPVSKSFGSGVIEESINANARAYRARKAPQSRRPKRSRTTTKWSITSMIEAYHGTERLIAAGTGNSRYIMFWKCNCGHIGFDHYDELQPGAVHDLLESFEKQGIKAFIEGCDPNRPNPPYLKCVRLEIFITNLYTWLCVCISAWLRNQEWSSPVAMRHGRSSDTVEDSSPSFKTAAEPTSGASSSSQNTNANTLNVNQQAHVATGAAIGTSATPTQSNQTSSSPATHTQVGAAVVNIPISFLLLCMKVERFLTIRHDLLITTNSDREVFEAIRQQYHSKFGWAYRQFSFQTIQKISFVKFALHPGNEVDGIKPGMPPETATHYTHEHRRPGCEPVLGNDFLMHRFSSPINCSEGNKCVEKFPKRVGKQPSPGKAPDFYTGWGIYLEQGLNLQRIFLVLFFGIASAGTFGLVWGVCKSVQDGFSIASFIVGSEAVAVAVVQILLSVETI